MSQRKRSNLPSNWPEALGFIVDDKSRTFLFAFLMCVAAAVMIVLIVVARFNLSPEWWNMTVGFIRSLPVSSGGWLLLTSTLLIRKQAGRTVAAALDKFRPPSSTS
jgi:hypothetical protein